jgi:hypothetical protein
LAIALSGIATCCCVAPARAGDPAGFVPSYSGSQVMLYVSWSFAARGTPRESFGFRYERASPASGDPAARFCAPLAHRSLVDLQFTRGAGPRMQFGPRVTWDISHGRLAPTSLLRTWPMPAAPLLPAATVAWVP